VVVDGRGNGRSDRPEGPAAYTVEEDVSDLVAVLDATGTDRAVVVGLSLGARRGLALAAAYPDRVAGLVAIAPAAVAHRSANEVARARFDPASIRADFPGFVGYFHSTALTDPHSTKPFEDAVGWGLETTPDALAMTLEAPALGEHEVMALLERVTCPLLVTQGTEDHLVPADRGPRFAELTGAELLVFEGAGHCPHTRHPVAFNLAVREFAERAYGRTTPRRVWRRAVRRPKRALCWPLGSPSRAETSRGAWARSPWTACTCRATPPTASWTSC